MTVIAEFIESGWMAALAAALVIVEILVFLAWRRAARRRAPALVANLLAGLCLMGALGAAQAGAPWTVIAALLSGALVAHLADLRARFREADDRGA